MDCRTFRKHHFEYLDDTMPGDLMASAQAHIMSCDACAAHDTMVRRSLMMVRNLPTIEPSDRFSARLQERLAHCRTEREQRGTGSGVARFAEDDRRYEDAYLETGSGRPLRRLLRGSGSWFAVAACVTVLGAMTIEGGSSAPLEVEMAPVLASAPQPLEEERPLVSPEVIQAMATGNPMFSMALLVDEAPAHFLATSNVYGGEYEHEGAHDVR